MNTDAQVAPREGAAQGFRVTLRSEPVRTIAGVLALALAYYGAAKLGQTVRYTASVAAIWPPAGLGIAALYLWGLRWWPGIFLGEVIVNAELVHDVDLPIWSVVGQQTGNMLEIMVGAILLRRLIGPDAALDRISQVLGMLLALVAATAISATVGTISMLTNGVIEASEAPTFLRTWFLGDTTGGLLVLPLALTWIGDPVASWRRIWRWEGLLLVTTVALVSVVAVSADEPVTYLVFPALIWASLRFGPPGATLAVAVAAGVAIGLTANEVGPFAEQTIDHRTLSTQVFIAVAALTCLFLSALASERDRSVSELAEEKRLEGERAVVERHRIARELHDSVSQALFSTVLQTRNAKRALERDDSARSEALAHAIATIGDLTVSAQKEMRALLFELNGSAGGDGLLPRLERLASELETREGLVVDVQGPTTHLSVPLEAQSHLFGISREALANVAKHSGASTASVRLETGPHGVSMEVRDNGSGFDTRAPRPGHYGLASMRSRADELGANLSIWSAVGEGTVVRVDLPASDGEATDGA